MSATTREVVSIKQRVAISTTKNILAKATGNPPSKFSEEQVSTTRAFLNIMFASSMGEVHSKYATKTSISFTLMSIVGIKSPEAFIRTSHIKAVVVAFGGASTELKKSEDGVSVTDVDMEVLSKWLDSWAIKLRGSTAKSEEYESDGFGKTAKKEAKKKKSKPIKIDEGFYKKPKIAVTLEKVLDSKLFLPILLTGHSGCGKSSLLELLATERKQKPIRINLNGDMSVDDFVGTYEIKDGETKFLYGPLPRAMMEGRPLILDEYDAAPPEINFVLQAVLDGNALTITKKGGEEIEPKKGFQIWATANTKGRGDATGGLYAGTSTQNDAQLDRFAVCITMDYLPKAQERLVLSTRTGIDEGLAGRMVDVADGCRAAFNKDDVYTTFSTRKLLAWAKLTKILESSDTAFEVAVLGKLGEEDEAAFKDIKQRIM